MADAYVRFYDFIVHHTDDAPLILRSIDKTLAATGRTAGKVLEMGAGTGRLSIPLAQHGHSITALDLSPTMLALAAARLSDQSNAADLRAKLEFVTADFTRPPTAVVPPTHYDFVLFSSNTFALVTNPTGQNRALETAFAALRPGGMVYIEQFNPAGFFDDAFRQREVYHMFTRINPATGLRTARFISFLHDAVTQHLFATTFIEEFLPDDSGGGSRRHMFLEHLRYNTWPEFHHRLQTTGFVNIQAYGGYHGEPLDHRRLRLIVTATRP